MVVESPWDKHLSVLTSSNKGERRVALTQILAQLETLLPPPRLSVSSSAAQVDSDDEQEDGKKEQDFNPLILALLTHLADPVEKVRELSYSCLSTLARRTLPLYSLSLAPYLPSILPILQERLGGEELLEAEEVRLQALHFMLHLLDSVGPSLSPYIHTWVGIIAVGLGDPYPEVVRVACTLTSSMAKALPGPFHDHSPLLHAPLISSLTHKQSKVRLESVLAIREVGLSGSPKTIPEFFFPLTLRLFDAQPKVRAAVVEAVGAWTMGFSDRYSYFHKLLPILLSGLGDEAEVVVGVATSTWEKVGEVYLQENLQEYKDAVDYEDGTPPHYPEGVRRPNLGCRLLVQRNVGKIVPGLGNDLRSWGEETRGKSAQLLYQLILHAEGDITMHVDGVVGALLRAASDPTNPTLTKYISMSSNLLGYFVPFPTIWRILAGKLRAAPESAFPIASSVIEGVEVEALLPQLEEVTSIIAELSQTHKSSRQRWILRICETLTRCGGSGGREAIFKALFTVLAMAQDEELKERALVGLHQLRQSCGLTELEQLFSAYSHPIVEEIQRSPAIWSPSSPEHLLLSSLLSLDGGRAMGSSSRETILQILLQQLHPKKEVEVRLSLLSLLSEILGSYDSKGMAQEESFLKSILEEVLLPNLVWHAGTSASAIRAASLHCLLVVLEGKLLQLEHRQSSGIVERVLPLLEDPLEPVRLLSTQSLGRLGEATGRKLGAELTHKIYPELLKRLDDEKDEVRVSAALALSRLFSNTPEDYDATFYANHLEWAAAALLVHLDDEDENVQGAVSEALQSVGAHSPSLLIGKCETFKGRHRRPDNCEHLIQHFKSCATTTDA